MLKAVIFDFDGVIADSEPLHYKAINTIVQRFGINIPKEIYWQKYLGFTDADCFRAISDDYKLGFEEETICGLVEEKFVVFEKLANVQSTIIDGVTEFINILKDNSVAIAICSGALLGDIRIMLQGSTLKDAFDLIVTADTKEVKRGKPYPDGYLFTLEKLNADRDEQIAAGDCIVIEDSHWGLEAASAAGMKSVAVTNTYPVGELEGYADMIVEHLDELAFEKLNSLCS